MAQDYLASVLPVPLDSLDPIVLTVAASLLGILLVSLARNKGQNPSGLPLPPGPKPLPLIGNVLDIPKQYEYFTYNDWRKTYGDLIWLNILGKPLMIVNSAKIAHDLFEKRSTNYSDRPRLPMIVELMGWDWNLGVMRYTERYKEHRRLFHNYFSSSATQRYNHILRKEAQMLIRVLFDKPNDFQHQLKHMAARAIMLIAYGHEVATDDDEYVQVAEAANKTFSDALNPGSFLVDFMPALKHVPAWFPGASFKRKAREWRKLSRDLIERPFEAVKRKMKEGKALPSFTSTLLEESTHPEAKIDEETVQNTAAMAYAAGADTTVSALTSFVLAMVLHPEVQERAQAELDSVLHDERLPDYTDRGQTPYLEAIINEILRWNPVTPLGVGHAATEDDTYNGWFIPKGTVMLPNQWALLHDPEVYPDPLSFKPERFLEPGVKDPRTAAFGFGRRICPGRWMADSELWITFATILATLHIGRARDEKGKEIIPEGRYNSGFLAHPLPFDADIKPRSLTVVRLINEALEHA
ncbi:cytochrome P450 [Hysterangium stoloniferum]|nr:cytochrome P450 [Hysterangium stoloniferum]